MFPHRAFRRLYLTALAFATATTLVGCSFDSLITATGGGPAAPAAAPQAASQPNTQFTIDATANAAHAYLRTLDPQQHLAATTHGLELEELSPEQRTAALAILDELLNAKAYRSVSAIMASAQYMRDSGITADGSAGHYTLALRNTPSSHTPWELHLSGPHLYLNAAFEQETISFSPLVLGVQPTEFITAEGHILHPLSHLYTTAFTFFHNLNAQQRERIYAGPILGPWACEPDGASISNALDGDPALVECPLPAPEGLPGSALNDAQKELLIRILANWVALSDDATNATNLAPIRESLDETYITWSGATEYDSPEAQGIYFRIIGPEVFLEFGNQFTSDDAVLPGISTNGWGHIHSLYLSLRQ